MMQLVLIVVTVLAVNWLLKPSASVPETFIKPSITEDNYGKAQFNEFAGKPVAATAATKKTKTQIENFFDEETSGPIGTSYNAVKPNDKNPNKYGPRPMNDHRQFDETGTVEFEQRDTFKGMNGGKKMFDGNSRAV